MQHRKLILSSFIALAAWSATAMWVRGAPSTQPVKKAAVNDRDSLLVRCDPAGFQFRVPKAWKKTQEIPEEGRYEFIFGGDDLPKQKAPSAPAKPKKPARGGKPAPDPVAVPAPAEHVVTSSNLEVNAGRACHGEPTLAAQVQLLRDRAIKESGSEKLIMDEPTTFAGMPANKIAFDASFEVTAVDSTTGAQKKITVKQREVHILSVKDGKFYSVHLTCDRSVYERHLKLFDRVVSTFEWTADPTTKPAS